MSEMRLICPSCEAEYRLPPAAIPAGGREVECSACGNVWTATPADLHGKRLDLSRFAAPVTDRSGADEIAQDSPHDEESDDERLTQDAPRRLIPPPSSKLAPSLLDLLREEVEHERRLRAAEAQDRHPARRDIRKLRSTAQDAGIARPIDDTDWPATTVTDASRDIAPAAARDASISAEPVPQVIRHIPTPRPDRGGTPEGHSDRSPDAARDQTADLAPQGTNKTTLPAPVVKRGASRGYRNGFGLAVMVAASLVALYLLAPLIAESDHAIGAPLLEFRTEIDRLRLWLGEHAAQLLGRA